MIQRMRSGHKCSCQQRPILHYELQTAYNIGCSKMGTFTSAYVCCHCAFLSKQRDDADGNGAVDNFYSLYWNITTIEILGKNISQVVVGMLECPVPSWGQNCENMCPCETSECDNVVGCTSCSGYPGWTGPNCDQDIDECLNTTYCGPNSDCINTNGSVICDCHSWYQRVSDRCDCKYWNEVRYYFIKSLFKKKLMWPIYVLCHILFIRFRCMIIIHYDVIIISVLLLVCI